MDRNFLHMAVSTSAARGYPGCTGAPTPRTPRRFVDASAERLFSDGIASLSPRPSMLSPRAFNSAPRSPRYLGSPLRPQDVDEKSDYSEDPSSPTQRSNLLSPSHSICTPPILTPFLIREPSVQQSEADKLGTFSAVNIILGKTIGVGIYSVPSSIFADVGSIGMSLLVWFLAAAISFCGLAVYLDLGTAMPRSGGEKVYLERIFRRPKFLMSCVFMSYVVLLGFSTPNCIVLGEYAMYALDVRPNQWNVRTLAVIAVTISCAVHARAPRLGLQIINVLGLIKMLIIVTIGVAGVISVINKVGMTDNDPSTATAAQNYLSLFAGSSVQPYAYATAILKALYCFRGYSTANQVLSEVRNPVQTLRKAGPSALSIVTAAYVITNLAYFAAVPKSDVAASGVVVAGHFFRNVFGEFVGERILPLLIILSAFGSIAATSFAQARVNQELAREDLVPFSGFWASSRPWGTPAAGLLLHWIVSVAVIVLPPPGQVYAFLITLGAYPVSVLGALVSGGLLYLQYTPSERWKSPTPAPLWAVATFFAANIVLVLLPWLPPTAGCIGGRHGGMPSYAYPAGGLAILGAGAVYWCWWGHFKHRWQALEDRIIRGALGELDWEARHNSSEALLKTDGC